MYLAHLWIVMVLEACTGLRAHTPAAGLYNYGEVLTCELECECECPGHFSLNTLAGHLQSIS